MSNKAFIFDLDGVIVDTAKYHFLAWKELADSLGFDFTEKQNELLKGVSRVRSLEILLDIGNVELSQAEKDKYLIEKNEQYLSYIAKMDTQEILPGIPELLAFLKAEKIPFALGSASKNARLILENLKLLDDFDAIVDGNDVSTAKPDPEVFLIAAEKLNKKPKDCVVIEDAAAGVQAANSAGMTSVAIGDPEVLSGADYNLTSTKELTPALARQLIN
ncbi:MAG: beta-phosphoglucomutase [Lutimonas sp.]